MTPPWSTPPSHPLTGCRPAQPSVVLSENGICDCSGTYREQLNRPQFESMPWNHLNAFSASLGMVSPALLCGTNNRVQRRRGGLGSSVVASSPAAQQPGSRKQAARVHQPRHGSLESWRARGIHARDRGATLPL